ncbi:MAG: hypothetical protein IJU02_04065 [Lachnospiraceae bacterium]|nr:hypothetical protein [Lachnospiraceae bacterium]
MSLFGNKTIYFIDSENVNDNWIDTIPEIKKSDEIKVFYTEKSTNVSYEKFSKIADGGASLNWIKCFTGQNALDFQLVTDLGYSVAKGVKDTFVIISNDKGYDAVVNYWVVKGINISRVGVEMESPKKQKRRVATKVKAVKKVALKSKKKETTNQEIKKQDTKKQDTKKQESKSKEASNIPKTLWKRKPSSEMGYVEAVGRCISVKDLGNYHMVLTNLFGQEVGTKYYHMIKDDNEIKAKVSKTYITNREQRLDYLVRIFLSYNKKDFKDLQKILNVINDKKCDSLNNFYKLLTENFKEEKGRMYYNILKGIYSVLKGV